MSLCSGCILEFTYRADRRTDECSVSSFSLIAIESAGVHFAFYSASHRVGLGFWERESTDFHWPERVGMILLFQDVVGHFPYWKLSMIKLGELEELFM